MSDALVQDRVSDAPDYTPRQSAVLEEALRLLVEGGDRALTTAAIARAANCSKESLYKWFGDRDDLLAAMVSWQAAKVRVRTSSDMPADGADFRQRLEEFASDLLTVLSGDVSLALNRLAIGQASRDDSRLGALVLKRGRDAIRQRASALLRSGLDRGHLEFTDIERAYRALYGLVVGDLHVRMLLGDEPTGADRDFRRHAQRAIAQFFRLYGTADPDGKPSGKNHNQH
ncbi:TetR/AcrR family transcriptional regulator [Hoeflea sp. WL0058]|uniref:TetR/AcrR family transcriptional regulator n=1 Tax=Flavimaribacter sediminis TaxID=2865987 RepID=A0AAE2ZGS4_9HYPH|nr:TetR/AcrR family transcriptional regulator [Flavimaribacter sediminis]MBW8635849.1 TetR/AcrR family transcriptional regulator [Flavimaribacter sediminis]